MEIKYDNGYREISDNGSSKYFNPTNGEINLEQFENIKKIDTNMKLDKEMIVLRSTAYCMKEKQDLPTITEISDFSGISRRTVISACLELNRGGAIEFLNGYYFGDGKGVSGIPAITCDAFLLFKDIIQVDEIRKIYKNIDDPRLLDIAGK